MSSMCAMSVCEGRRRRTRAPTGVVCIMCIAHRADDVTISYPPAHTQTLPIHIHTVADIVVVAAVATLRHTRVSHTRTRENIKFHSYSRRRMYTRVRARLRSLRSSSWVGHTHTVHTPSPGNRCMCVCVFGAVCARSRFERRHVYL